jgi:hypothetical protein
VIISQLTSKTGLSSLDEHGGADPTSVCSATTSAWSNGRRRRSSAGVIQGLTGPRLVVHLL